MSNTNKHGREGERRNREEKKRRKRGSKDDDDDDYVDIDDYVDRFHFLCHKNLCISS